MENMAIISKNIKAVNVPLATWLAGNNTALKHFMLVLKYERYLFNP